MTAVSVTFSMPCPECDADVDDIEGTYTECWGREEFWGAPVVTDESEFEVDHIPECPSCKRVTLDPGVVSDWFWSQEVASYV